MGFPILWFADYEALGDKSPAMVNTLHIYDQKPDQYTSITHPASVHLVATTVKQFANSVTLYCPQYLRRCAPSFFISQGENIYMEQGKKGDQEGVLILDSLAVYRILYTQLCPKMGEDTRFVNNLV